jgi:dihydroflavonol-4-reductase
VFVTGGSGIVGRAVVRRLVAEGREVRALARSETAAAAVRGLGAAPVPGDVLDGEAMAGPMRGCEVVFNVAGVNQLCLRDPSGMFRVNVDGAAVCLEAAAWAGVRRVVHTSSAATLGEARGTVGREDSPHRGSFLSAYERSKYEGEQRVLALGAARDVEVVCVNPSSVQGPGRSTGTAELLVRYLQGRLRVWIRTPVSLVDIDDCAEGHALAATKGAAGQRYLLSGATLEPAELFAVMGRVAPHVRPPRLVPAGALWVAGAVAEVAGRARGGMPALCRESVRTVLHGHRYDGSRAERELGLQYRPVEETLRRTVEWLEAEGLV